MEGERGDERKADAFTITQQSAVLDVSTGRYIEQQSNPVNGSFPLMGTAPAKWTFAIAGSASSSGQTTIMPLGDSITEGYAALATFAQGGYRCPLYSLLERDGVQFTFVGDSTSLEPGILTACPDVNWEGHGGDDTASIQGFEDADGSVRTLQPDIILLLSGTNDVAQGETSSVSRRLTSLLSGLYAQDLNAWVIISTIQRGYRRKHIVSPML